MTIIYSWDDIKAGDKIRLRHSGVQFVVQRDPHGPRYIVMGGEKCRLSDLDSTDFSHVY